MNEQENFVTCACQHCNGNIEFDASLFQTGAVTTCPHCGMETPLFIPTISKPAEKKTEKAPAKTAEVIKRIRHYGGMENTLEDVGGLVLGLGIFCGIGAIIGAIVAFNDDQTGTGANLLCVGVGLIFAGAVNRILFRAAAEVIRLLKKLNRLKFSGKISEPETLNVYTCSSCGTSIYEDAESCYSCNAKFKK